MSSPRKTRRSFPRSGTSLLSPPPLVILSERSGFEGHLFCARERNSDLPRQNNCHPEERSDEGPRVRFARNAAPTPLPAPCHPERAQRVEGHLFCARNAAPTCRAKTRSSRGAQRRGTSRRFARNAAPTPHPAPCHPERAQRVEGHLFCARNATPTCRAKTIVIPRSAATRDLAFASLGTQLRPHPAPCHPEQRSESKDICFALGTQLRPAAPKQLSSRGVAATRDSRVCFTRSAAPTPHPAPCHPERAQRVEGDLFCAPHHDGFIPSKKRDDLFRAAEKLRAPRKPSP